MWQRALLTPASKHTPEFIEYVYTIWNKATLLLIEHVQPGSKVAD